MDRADWADWSRRNVYATMRRSRRSPVPAPFSRAEFEAFEFEYVTRAVQRHHRRPAARRTGPERWEIPHIATLLDQIHEAADADRGQAYRAAPPRVQKRMREDQERWKWANRAAFATSAAHQARARTELRRAVGSARTRMARLCRKLLAHKGGLPRVRAKLDIYTDAFDLAGYQARREFLWTFLRAEAAAALQARPGLTVSAVARELHRAYPWLPAADPLPATDPPPPLTVDQIEAGLMDAEDPATADAARRFGFASAKSLLVSRIQLRRR